MNLRKYLLIAGATLALTATAQQINPITQAMLDGYQQLLDQNPNDYFTLYERASQYYRLSRYDLALNDIKKSIENTPLKEKDQLASEYSLAADILIQTKDYALALDNINQALKFSPNNYSYLYTKGNICLYLNDLQGAKGAFTAMMSVKSRSQEALFGLAKVALLEGKTNEAVDYMNQAEKLEPTNYITYCRLGDLHKDMKDNRRAAADYISAFSLPNNSDRPMLALIELATIDYPAVIEALEFSESKTSNTAPINFLRGNVARATGHYADAYEAYRHLTESGKISPAAVAPTMADICLHSGNLTEADNYASSALIKADNEANNLLKAQIEEARGNYDSALIYALKAARFANSESALLEAATLQMALKDYVSAQSTVSNALLSNPANLQLLLLKAYINKQISGGGITEYVRAATTDAHTDEELTYKAIAQALAGYTLDASSTIAPILTKVESDANCAVLAALYYMNSCDNANALKMKQKAEELGYEDEYMLKYSVSPLFSLASVKE